ncbi:toll-like receptor 4 [Ostrea edulis]|uniref:toll-like receptor 4 n=1 Tax=Ostrea edulis TaxID=37623 RepID=UPI0024AFB228|nr:toll-like receptor 4 [Ostrea edulis]
MFLSRIYYEILYLNVRVIVKTGFRRSLYYTSLITCSQTNTMVFSMDGYVFNRVLRILLTSFAIFVYCSPYIEAFNYGGYAEWNPCLEKINCSCFEQNKTIVMVDCSDRRLKYVPHLPSSVKWLNLRKNLIKNISSNSKKIPHLNVSDNDESERANRQPFDGLRNLQYLDISSNSLENVDPGVFKPLKSLVSFNMKYNSKKLGENWSNVKEVLNSFKSLEELRIDVMGNISFAEGFPGLRNLSLLDVSGLTGICEMRIIQRDFFLNTPFLKHLDISSCKIKHIEEGAFGYLKNLETLHISYNKELGFASLPNITYSGWRDYELNMAKIEGIKNRGGLGHLFVIILPDAFDVDRKCPNSLKDLIGQDYFLRYPYSTTEEVDTIELEEEIKRYFLHKNPRAGSGSIYKGLEDESQEPLLVADARNSNAREVSINSENQQGALRYPYDVFISYVGANRKFVMDEVKPRLEENGLKVFIRDIDFEAGDNKIDNIMRALGKSSKTICMVSKPYLKSKWRTYELNMAKMEGMKSRGSLRYVQLILMPDLFEESTSCNTKIRDLIDQKCFLECPPKDSSLQDIFWRDLIRKFLMEELKPRLEENGLKVFIRDIDFEVGDNKVENIMRALGRSKKTICVVSKSYLKSKWRTYELNMAKMKGMKARGSLRYVQLILMPDLLKESTSCNTKIRD